MTTETAINSLSRATLEFVADQPTLANFNLLIDETLLEQTGGSITSSGTNQYNLTLKFSLNIQLQTGTTCTFITGFNNLRLSTPQPIIAMGISSGGYITGYFVAE